MKKILITLVVLVAWSFQTQAQELNCGTEVSLEQAQFMLDLMEGKGDNPGGRSASTFDEVVVPLQFIIVRESGGSGGFNPSLLPALLNDVNSYYSNAGIVFRALETKFVDNDDFFNYDSSQETALAAGNETNGAVNVFLIESVSAGGTPVGGYAYVPQRGTKRDRIFVRNVQAFGTTEHELGHYLGLFHTHGVTNNGTTDELVTRGVGANCETAGDQLCDTPADPNFRSECASVSGCTYTGDCVDRNGDSFNPEAGNIMSYAPQNCASFFTAGQYERVRTTLESFHTNLSLEYSSFTPNFSSDSRFGCAPVTIEFTDLTNNASGREWSFEGGSISSSSRRTVSVTFDQPGNYDVSLTVTNANGQTATATRSNFVIVSDPYQGLDQRATSVGFEELGFPSTWFVGNPDRLTSFETSDSSVDEIGGSVVMKNFGYSPEVGLEVDELRLSSLDVDDIRAFSLSFSYAYSGRQFVDDGITNTVDDLFLIGYTTDCDDRFYEIERLTGDNLRTTDPQESEFVPTADDWADYAISINTVDLSDFSEIRAVRPAMRNVANSGNNLYLDNIAITPNFSVSAVSFYRGYLLNENTVELRWSNQSVINSRRVIIERSFDGVNYDVIDTVSSAINIYKDDISQLDESVLYYRVFNANNKERSAYSPVAEVDLQVLSTTAAEQTIRVFPNPTSGVAVISLPESLSDYELMITDLTGRRLVGIPSSKVGNRISFDLSSLESGMFFVELRGEKISFTKRIIKK